MLEEQSASAAPAATSSTATPAPSSASAAAPKPATSSGLPNNLQTLLDGLKKQVSPCFYWLSVTFLRLCNIFHLKISSLSGHSRWRYSGTCCSRRAVGRRECARCDSAWTQWTHARCHSSDFTDWRHATGSTKREFDSVFVNPISVVFLTIRF